MKRRRTLLLSVIALIVFGALALEAGLRLIGGGDFPLYVADPRIGYFPAPNQHGRFLLSHTWVFNERSMGVAARFVPSADSALLVGDSVVYGGNVFRQPEKLGPQLGDACHCQIYPLAAGGWSLTNELEMLRKNADVLRSPKIVFVVNSGDFGAAAPLNTVVTPTTHPVSVLAFFVRKYALHAGDQIEAEPSSEALRRLRLDLAWLRSTYHGQIVWIMYPKLVEVGAPVPDAFRFLTASARPGERFLWVGGRKDWRRAYYRDGRIHPGALGNRILAGIISEAMAGRSGSLDGQGPGGAAESRPPAGHTASG